MYIYIALNLINLSQKIYYYTYRTLRYKIIYKLSLVVVKALLVMIKLKLNIFTDLFRNQKALKHFEKNEAFLNFK